MSDGFGASRSPLQIGAELYGHAGPDSDVEIVCLMMASLKAAGVQDIYLDLGHVGIFRGLARQAGLDEATESKLFEALQRKAQPEIAALVAGAGVSGETADMLCALAELNGDDDVLEQARQRLAGASAEVHEAIDYVEAVAARLRNCLPGVPLHFDLAELRAYHYQTGVVFAAFVPGMGQEIARGGRYDHIGEVFGRARPATGFSADLKNLLAVGRVDLPAAPGKVFAPAVADAELAAKIDELRAAGRVVIRELPGQAGDAAAMGCAERLVQAADGNWELASV